MAHPTRRPQSFDELADLAELGRLVIDYATAIDGRAWDDLDSVFTPDAHIDYTAMGGIAGPFPEVKAWLADVMGNFAGFQHLVANHAIDLDGARPPGG